MGHLVIGAAVVVVVEDLVVDVEATEEVSGEEIDFVLKVEASDVLTVPAEVTSLVADGEEEDPDAAAVETVTFVVDTGSNVVAAGTVMVMTVS